MLNTAAEVKQESVVDYYLQGQGVVSPDKEKTTEVAVEMIQTSVVPSPQVIVRAEALPSHAPVVLSQPSTSGSCCYVSTDLCCRCFSCYAQTVGNAYEYQAGQENIAQGERNGNVLQVVVGCAQVNDSGLNTAPYGYNPYAGDQAAATIELNNELLEGIGTCCSQMGACIVESGPVILECLGHVCECISAVLSVCPSDD